MTFRKMRRSGQLLTVEECNEILNNATSGVLALIGDEGYPYTVPLSFAYHEGRLIFHCLKSGHKIDAIKNCDKASFCVIAQDDVIPENYATNYKSIIAFGKVKILSEKSEITEAINIFAEKYRPGYVEERNAEIEEALPRLCMFVLEIEHMTGKAAKALIERQ
ncbi:MAG: 5-nitroimidazole antibiotic resistance protein [Anaerofustis stercorihominis]|nr:5-nitroimidazole antibiotic resistance protein [Anaerofustis stercorihominis]